MDICQSVHWGWVKIPGNVMWVWTLEGTCMFGQGNDITPCICHWIVYPKIDTTTHRTGLWLTRPNMGGVIGKYTSVSGGWTNWCLPPWCRVLPPIRRGTLAASWRVALYPHCTEYVNGHYRNQNQGKPELPNGLSMGTCSPKGKGWITRNHDRHSILNHKLW